MVTLAIGVAFVAVMLLLLGQNVDFAVSYTEKDSDILASEVVARTASFLDEQDAVLASGALDSQLSEALSRAEAGASDADAPDGMHAAGPADATGEIAALLEQLAVSDSCAMPFLVSLETGSVYFSQEASKDAQADSAILRAYALDKLVDDGNGNGSRKADVFALAGGQQVTASARPIMRAGQAVALVGICVRASALSDVMSDCLVDQGQEAVFFGADGTIYLSTGGEPADEDVYALYPQVNGLRDALSPDASQRWRVWEGLDGVFPHDQRLYAVSYCPAENAYLLLVNDGASAFDEMRMRSTNFLLAMVVVMAMLALIAMTGMRFYRSRIMRITATDELTGLANRKSFAERYDQRFRKDADEADDAVRASLAIIDVDYFKRINDTYGHSAGDEALAAIAAEVNAATGDDGLAGRWGGDEFIGVFVDSPDGARRRAEQLVKRVAALEFSNNMHTSISVGMAEIDATQMLERVIERADDALYVTKEGGRGFLTVYDPASTPHSHQQLTIGLPDAGDRVEPVDNTQQGESAQPETAEAEREASAPEQTGPPGRRAFFGLLVQSLLDAVGKMIPFVAGGGILVALAFLFDAASVDVNSLSEEMRANFGSITPLAAGLHDVGLAAFNFMLPIFAAFLARGMAGNKAFMAGFAGGFLSSQGSSGFVGAIATALIAALVVWLMDNFLREMSDLLRRIASVIIIPVFSLLIMYLFMVFVIDPFAAAFDELLTSMLASLMQGSRVVLGAVCGAMMSTDMGGFINKAAYHFGTASIDSGSPEVMASVMVGGMVAPCGIALSMVLFRDRFTDVEFDLAPTTFVLGLSFITEGALPFVLTDFARVIPSCMAGSALAGGLSAAYGCTLMAPHGGIFVFPVVGEPLMYLVSLAAGSLLCAIMLGWLKGLGRKRM